MVKNILELDAEAAKDFFLESSRYCTIEFPSYINFSELLKHINNNLPKDAIEKIQKGKKNNEVRCRILMALIIAL